MDQGSVDPPFYFFLGSISFLTNLKISSIASAILFNCSISIISFLVLI